MLSRSVHDAGWAAFFSKLSYLAENAGRLLVAVDARGTSQRCPCGEPNITLLANREHVCSNCGLLLHETSGGYRNIKTRTEPSVANGGAVKLLLTEKPRLQSGKYVTRRTCAETASRTAGLRGSLLRAGRPSKCPSSTS